MGIKDLLINDLNNIFFNDDNFFSETVTYSVLNADRTYTNSTIIVNLSRKQEFLFDDADGGEVIPAHCFIRTSDIAVPKYGDLITDSSGNIWTLQYLMSEESGLIKFMLHRNHRVKIKRYGI